MVSAPKRPARVGLFAPFVGLVFATALLAPTLGQADLRKPTTGHVQVGNASWYGKHHQGKKTASGEQFDPRQLTAAHPTLPLGSEVRVTNLQNGRWVDVRVTDRGPFGKHRRVIDVSQAAAEEIGLKRKGVAKVRIETLRAYPKPVAFHPY